MRFHEQMITLVYFFIRRELWRVRLGVPVLDLRGPPLPFFGITTRDLGSLESDSVRSTLCCWLPGVLVLLELLLLLLDELLLLLELLLFPLRLLRRGGEDKEKKASLAPLFAFLGWAALGVSTSARLPVYRVLYNIVDYCTV